MDATDLDFSVQPQSGTARAYSLAELTAGRTVLLDLQSLASITVTGDDARAFLNAQLSCDLAALPRPGTVLAAWCNPQGQVITVMRVVSADAGYRLIVPREMRDDLAQRLRRFVLRAEVQIGAEAAALLGLIGPGAAVAIDNAGGAVPESDGSVAAAEGICIVTPPGPVTRYLLLADPEGGGRLWRALASGLPLSTETPWRAADIEAGLPAVTKPVSERFLPQMLNLEQLGGLSFRKGCFPGQEVIARLKYRGVLKRSMHLLQADSPDPAEAGESVHGANGSTVGHVLSAAHVAPGQLKLLAVIELDAIGGDLHLGSPDGPGLRRLDLPYPA
jgi:folate-binding protein YgfZ